MKIYLYNKFLIRILVLIVVFSNFSKNCFSQIQHKKELFIGASHFPGEKINSERKIFNLSDEQIKKKEFYENYITPPGESLHAGFAVSVNVDPKTDGFIDIIGDSVLVWRVKISSPGAIGLGLLFEDFYLVENSALYIYDDRFENVLGEFNHKNNNEYNIFSSQLISGDELILEYVELLNDKNERIEISSTFRVNEIIHITQGLTDLEDDKNLGNSDNCQVNINCSEGDMWQTHKRGIARILMKAGSGYYWCSGSLVNNTNNNGAPYFLTAHHCGRNASPEDMRAWQFYFNFERTSCLNIGTPYYNVVYGGTLLAEAPILNGSDFKLLKLHQPPPPHYNVYYNGWNRLNESGNYGVGIHHPAGDAKKISTYESALSSSSPVISGQAMATNSAWRVTWIETDNGWGVTQGGSSGSPIFNEEGLIVGTLTGGSSSCSNTSFPDFYGKMSYHWDRNGPYYNEQLAYYLDPAETGEEYISGYDPNFENYPPPGFVSAGFEEGDVFIKWHKPGSTPNVPGWYKIADGFSGIDWSGPERKTMFDANYFDFSFPVTVTKLSHFFMEHPGNIWPSNEFRFKIYEYEYHNLAYQSPVLQAERGSKTIHELSEPLTFDQKFFVAVVPFHSSGHPSSMMQKVNVGHGVSFYGANNQWEMAGDEFNQYAFISSIYVANDFADKRYENQANILDKKTDNAKRTNTDPFQAVAEFYWGNAPSGYNVYRNDEIIHTLEPEDNDDSFSFLFSYDPGDEGYDKIYVTAVYDGQIESERSEVTYLFYDSLCNDIISAFPYNEVFEHTDMPECWTIEPAYEWSAASFYEYDEVIVNPFVSNNFAYALFNEESNYNSWFISPVINISELEKPALKFAFNSVINQENQNNCYPEVFISNGTNSFIKYWSAIDYPYYSPENSLTWLEAVIDLVEMQGKEELRIAFFVKCTEDFFVAIDDILVWDAFEELVQLNVVILPEGSGEVYGFGEYIPGEKAVLDAFPNLNFAFDEWDFEGESLSNYISYEFLMPDMDYSINAIFVPSDPVFIEENELSENKIHVFPNPTTGELQVNFSDDLDDVKNIRLYNASGLLIDDNVSFDTVGLSVKLNLSKYNLANGIYFIAITNISETKFVKVMVER